MSWDVIVMKFSEPSTSMDAISDDEESCPLGTISHVHATVSEHFPGTDWNDPAWGIFNSPFGSIEFNLVLRQSRILG